MFPPRSHYALEHLNPDAFLALRLEEATAPGARDFLCEYANPAAEALLEGPLPGKRLILAHPELFEAFNAWEQVLVTGMAHTRLLLLHHQPAPRRLLTRAVRVEEGLLAVWLSDVTDTERFVSETAAFEERMLSFVECMPDPFLAFDTHHRFVYVNRAAERLLGKPRQQLVGRTIAEETSGEAGSALGFHVQRALGSGGPVAFEERFRGLWLEATVTPTGSGVLVYLHDITVYRRATTAASRAQTLMHALLSDSTDAIYTKDLQGRYTGINEAGARLMGRQSEAILGHTDQELWPAETARATLAHDREVLAWRRTFTYEDEDPEPRARIWRSTKGVLRDETGDVSGLFGISRDITDAHRLREALSAASMTPWELRLPERRLYWEPGAEACFGLDKPLEDEPLEALLARLHPEDRPGVAEALRSETAQEVSLTWRVRLPDGTWRRQALRARMSDEPTGGRRMLGVLQDLGGVGREERVSGIVSA